MGYQKYNKLYFNKQNHLPLSKWKMAYLRLTKYFPFFSRYYFELLKVVDSLPSGAKVLDVGCSHGGFLNFLSNLRPDLKLYGTDLSNVGNLLPKCVTFIQADFIHDTITEASFDLVISRHLIEHLLVPDVPLFFDKTHQLLNSGGYCFILCPNLSNNFYNDPTHIRPYNKYSLDKLFRLSNYSKIRSFNCREVPFFGMKLSLAWGIK